MKILVALDFSPTSEAVLKSLASRPWPAETRMEVLTVVESEAEASASDSAHPQTMVSNAAERLSKAGIVAETTVITGDPKVAIAARASEIGADWIVVGPHRGSGAIDFLLGSVAKEVLRAAPCSVEIIRASVADSAATGMRVFLATDGSPSSLAAAHSVAKRQWPGGTEVRVLSAVELTPSFMQAAFEPPFADPQGMQEMREAAMGHAQTAIAEARTILEAAGLRTSESLSVLLEDAKKIILEEAAAWKADLIVVGSHGRHGLERLLLGSVSEAVALNAPCSVDVVRVPQNA